MSNRQLVLPGGKSFCVVKILRMYDLEKNSPTQNKLLWSHMLVTKVNLITSHNCLMYAPNYKSSQILFKFKCPPINHIQPTWNLVFPIFKYFGVEYMGKTMDGWWGRGSSCVKDRILFINEVADEEKSHKTSNSSARKGVVNCTQAHASQSNNPERTTCPANWT